MEIGAYLRVFREEPGPVPPAKVVRRLVAHRLRRRLRRAARRRQLRRGPIDLSEHRLLEETGRRDRDELLEHLRRRGSPRFFFEPAEMEALVAALRVDRPGSVQAAIGAADDVRAHVFDLLGSGRVELGGRIDWHRDLVTGHRWPLVPAFDVPREGAPAGTEIKRAWELSRCQHFVTLGRAYAFSRDESYAREFVQQLRSWIEENPPWIGVNWCTAMEVAIRAVNWIWAWHFFAEASAFGAEDRTLLLRSLVLHGEYLAENLEYFGPFSGNHYLADLVGLLAVATWLPELRRAKGWRRVARRRLEEEMAGQVLDDGVHFEGATSYHRLALEMFLFADLLCRRNGPSLSAAYRSRLEKMFEYVLHYTRPDGSAPQIGDNDDGRLLILGTSPPSDHRYLLSIAAALFARPDFKAAAGEFHEDALWLLGLEGRRAFAAVEPAGREPISRGFSDSGIYFLRESDDYLVATCGEVGRRGRGGHGHSDGLGFELWLGGQPVLVDPGCFAYRGNPEGRNVFRATASHNTLRVDGEDIDRFSPRRLFRMQRDARMRVLRWSTESTVQCLEALHTGYRRLPDPVTHRRTFHFVSDRSSWLLVDRVEGSAEHDLEWFFHFHPAVALTTSGPGSLRAEPAGGEPVAVVCLAARDLRPRIGDGSYSPAFGVKVPSLQARIGWRVQLPVTVAFAIYPWAAGLNGAVPEPLAALARAEGVEVS